MKYLALLIALACPLAAQTVISSCGAGATISTEGSYILNANLTYSATILSSPCIPVTGLPGNSPFTATLDCQGHSITSTSSSFPAYIFGIYSNSLLDTFTYKNCVISYSGMTGQRYPLIGNLSSPIVNDTNIVDFNNSYTNAYVDIECSGTGPGYATVIVGESGNGDTFTNSGVQIEQCQTPKVNYNTFNPFTGNYLSGGGFYYFVQIDSANNCEISNNNMTGAVNGSGAGVQDSPILLTSQNVSASFVAQVCNVHNNTVANAVGYCMETAGATSGVTFAYNACTNEEGMLGGHFALSENLWNVHDNTLALIAAQTPTYIFQFNHALTPGAVYSFFTNNTFINNTVSGTTSYNQGSVFGNSMSGYQFQEFCNNTFTGSDLLPIYTDPTTGGCGVSGSAAGGNIKMAGGAQLQ